VLRLTADWGWAGTRADRRGVNWRGKRTDEVKGSALMGSRENSGLGGSLWTRCGTLSRRSH